MRIEDLHVKNFRGFKERDFSFHPHFNVLIGDNATGKTALLRALRVAIASWFLGIKGRDTVGIRSDDVRLEGKAFEAGEYSFEEQYPVEVTASGSFKDLPWVSQNHHLEWTRTLGGPKGRTTRRKAKAVKKLSQEADKKVRDGKEVILPMIAFYGTSRLSLEPRRTQRRRSPSEKSDLSRLVGYQDCIDKRLDTKALTQWIERQSWMAWQEGGPSVLLQLVQYAITEIVEDATTIRYDPEREEVIVVFDEEYVYPLNHLSDGQRTTLTLVGDLAIRAARLNPHLGEKALQKTPGVVLIDEIDMHLHPTWQRHVVDDLKQIFPSVQFVTTTHSPFIIQALDQGEVYALNNQFPSTSLQNLGIEIISKEIMGVDHPEQALSYRDKVKAAKDYLLTLDEASDAPEDRLEEYKQRLASKLEPYADNPAFQAYLELEREGKLGE